MLSLEEAVRRHRMMWEWIAEESLRRKEAVTKEEAFKHFNWDSSKVKSRCWCCEYTLIFDEFRSDFTVCAKCPIKWPTGRCVSNLFGKYVDEYVYERYLISIKEGDYNKAHLSALEISNLPLNV